MNDHPNHQNPIHKLLGIKLSKTLLLMKGLIAAEFESRNFALSFEEWMNLLPLMERDGLTQKELAKILGKDKTTISRQISLWEKKGFVSRSVLSIDRRAAHLKVTDYGRKIHRDASPIVEELDQIFNSGLTQKETETLLKLLSKIRDSVLQFKQCRTY